MENLPEDSVKKSNGEIHVLGQNFKVFRRFYQAASDYFVSAYWVKELNTFSIRQRNNKRDYGWSRITGHGSLNRMKACWDVEVCSFV
ncbi:MAG: hypothetical protein ACLUDU_14660 [Butyricimonas faecihominis]